MTESVRSNRRGVVHHVPVLSGQVHIVFKKVWAHASPFANTVPMRRWPGLLTDKLRDRTLPISSSSSRGGESSFNTTVL
ncbi:hypothetical protein RSOLAG22IIIB_13966 [Rhizoctonia solani]|uniref:Uncharacterized protein n=1 Tax=Rhizoctonia solani TaxID=456999 RepID=A0A0K6FST0_9AGAM|nr:hypothetical protein RSOLAG22IIIB_13966 [Rhizoctonia solani]